MNIKTKFRFHLRPTTSNSRKTTFKKKVLQMLLGAMTSTLEIAFGVSLLSNFCHAPFWEKPGSHPSFLSVSHLLY